jgi:hypothetical protein
MRKRSCIVLGRLLGRVLGFVGVGMLVMNEGLRV